MSGPWQIEGDIARLRIGPLAAQLDLRRPQLGMREVSLGGFPATSAPATFLAVATLAGDEAEQIQDCYLRGSDLVVTYLETPERNIRPQLYWRAVEFPEDDAQAFGVDLIISTQTSELYSDPTLRVESSLPIGIEYVATNSAGERGPILFRLRPLAWSFAQAVHPSDIEGVDTALDAAGKARISHRLFAPGLEKGVIRRARVRGIFVPRERDEELAKASFAEFVAQELPLTT
jgi:hypothetical protein